MQKNNNPQALGTGVSVRLTSPWDCFHAKTMSCYYVRGEVGGGGGGNPPH